MHSIKFYLNNVLCIFIGINCESPGILVNGMVTSNGTYVTSVATFTCDFGYELIGSRQRVCQSDGTWSNMVPRCDGKLLVFVQGHRKCMVQPKWHLLYRFLG